MEKLSPAQYRALAEFRYRIRKFLSFSEDAARAVNLEPRQHQLLLAVKGFAGEPEGPTIGYLAERLQVRHHSTVELVNRMAGKGTVRRSVSERDRREVIVHLTARGEEILAELSAKHLIEIRQMGPGLLDALRGVLEGCEDG